MGRDGNPLQTIKAEKVASVTPMQRQHETIHLTPAESLLRELLLDCREHVKELQIAAASTLEIWITGGWVRDRLLGIPCADVDIALSTMTGKQFAGFVTDFFRQNEGQYQQRAVELGVHDTRFSVFRTTKENPGKSKKLETAVGRAFGLDLDLVNLRKEVYEDNSRTPEMEFGTAKEDASRRDATINALFFDLDKQQVADFTGKGLEDMTLGIVRTPLEPRQTLMDDPLRVLRLIRMSGKLGYVIDEEAKRWMKDGEIHAALGTKVSRDRIGIEVFKMMRTGNPQLAFHLLFELNLYALVFLGTESSLRQALQIRLPAQDPEKPWPSTWPRAYQVLAILMNDSVSSLGRMIRSQKRVEQLWAMAAFAPIAELRHDTLEKAVDGVVGAVRATHETANLLRSSLRNIGSIRATIALVHNHQGISLSRSSVGMNLRTWGASWELQVIYSLLAELVYETSPPTPLSVFPSADNVSADNDANLRKVQEYNTFVDFVLEQGLEDAHLLKPILDGNAMMRLFGVAKGGSFLKVAIDELVAWQFDHAGLGKEDAQEWLLRQRGKLKIPLSIE